MKRMMVVVVLAVAGIAAADSDTDALKVAREKEGDAEIQFRIGNCYAKGKILAKDKVAAAKWYRRAAEQGHVVARDRQLGRIGRRIKRETGDSVSEG